MSENSLNFLSSDAKNLLLKIYEAILEKVTIKMYNNLDEETKGSFLKIISSGSEEDKINFLKQYFSNFKSLLTEEIEKLVQQLKASKNSGL
jgi:hypothetical protein